MLRMKKDTTDFSIKWLFAIVLVSTVFTSILFAHISLIGAMDEESYYFDRRRVVMVTKIDDRYVPIYDNEGIPPNAVGRKSFGPFKVFARNLPPTCSVEVGHIKLPLLIWPHGGSLPYLIQNVFVGINPSVASARIPVILIAGAIVTLAGVLGYILFGPMAGILSTLALASCSFFFFMSILGSSINFLFIMLCLSLCLILILRPMRFSPFILAVLSALGIWSYSGFALMIPGLLVASYLTGFRGKAITLFLVFVGFSSAPYLICSGVQKPPSWIHEITSSSFTFLRLLTSFALQTPLGRKIDWLIEDWKCLLDFKGLGKHLSIPNEYEASILPSLGLSLSLLGLFASGFVSKKTKPLLGFVAMYVIAQVILFPGHGFHRRLALLVLLACVGFGWLAQFKRLQPLALIILVLHMVPQVTQTIEIIRNFKSGLTLHIYRSMDVDRELANFLLSRGIYKPVNLSALINLEMLTKGRLRPIDYSYMFIWSELLIKKDIGSSVLHANVGKYAILSDYLDFRWTVKRFDEIAKNAGLMLKRVATFPANPILILVRIERPT